jgi:acyl-CoA reductase-like NAD-dependent aldehyde dehydrogenase
MTRIEQARRKGRIARDAIVVASVAGFAVFAGLARASHPGAHHSAVTGTTATGSASAAQSNGYFGDDSYSYLGPSGSAAPQTQSGAS